MRRTDGYEVTLSPLSYELRVFDRAQGQSMAGKTKYIFGANITDLGMNECRMHLAMGEEVPVAALKEIARVLYEHGFRWAYFETSRPSRFTTIARAVSQVGPQTRYVIDLTKIVNR